MLSNGRGGVREAFLTVSFRGSKSRNKVSVGEPAEGSLLIGFLARLCELFSARSSASRSGGGTPGSPPEKGVSGGESRDLGPPAPQYLS